MAFFFEFTSSELPKTRNQLTYTNRYERVREKNKWLSLVSLAIGPDKPEKPLNKAKITCIKRSSRVQDYDGLVSSFKYIIDAFVKLHIIEDDNLYVVPNPSYKWEKVKRKEGGIVVRVESYK